MTAPLSVEPYRAKLWKNKRGETYFTLVYCPACNPLAVSRLRAFVHVAGPPCREIVLHRSRLRTFPSGAGRVDRATALEIQGFPSYCRVTCLWT